MMRIEKYIPKKPTVSINDVAKFQGEYDKKYGEQISYSSASEALENGLSMVKARHLELKRQGRWKKAGENKC